MNGKYVLIVWTIFLTIMGFYILNPREMDDIKAVDLNQSSTITFNITQKENLEDEGITKTTSNIDLANAFLSYMDEFTFRKPFHTNFDELNKISPSYNVTILDESGDELLYLDIIGDQFLSMNDKRGTLRNYIPKDDGLFDFTIIEGIYNAI